MNLQPWIDGDLEGQEFEGYNDGVLHCKQGWCSDSCADGYNDTPYLRGCLRGWDATKQAGLHDFKKLLYVRFCFEVYLGSRRGKNNAI